MHTCVRLKGPEKRSQASTAGQSKVFRIRIRVGWVGREPPKVIQVQLPAGTSYTRSGCLVAWLRNLQGIKRRIESGVASQSLVCVRWEDTTGRFCSTALLSTWPMPSCTGLLHLLLLTALDSSQGSQHNFSGTHILSISMMLTKATTDILFVEFPMEFHFSLCHPKLVLVLFSSWICSLHCCLWKHSSAGTEVRNVRMNIRFSCNLLTLGSGAFIWSIQFKT